MLNRDAQTGGITILVALLLLVLLTLSAVGMSRNSVRDIVASGFGRQAAMTREVSDSGIEWSIYWMTTQNANGAAGSALALAQAKTYLSKNPSLAGVSTDIFTLAQPYVPGGAVQPDLQWVSPTGAVEGYTVGLTKMGTLAPTGMSQGNGQGAYSTALGGGGNTSGAPELWAVRTDAQVVQGPVTFIQAQEAWISTPVQ